jgi:shikimate kinase
MHSMNRLNVVLTGFMGTGKSTIGRLLSQQLDYHFIDTDVLIESCQHRSVAEIFVEQGEAAFRRMETEVAQELCQQDGLVIATGGKLLLDPANRECLGRNGRIFCLTADSDEIVRRLNKPHSRAKRPLLSDPDPEQRIRELFEQRAAEYSRFEQINTTGKTPVQICHTLLELLQYKPR